jgi:hypothetical protein
MKRDQLEHVLRAASQIADDPDILVIGSQSVLGAIAEERLPLAATASIEVDVAFFDDPEDRKADRVDGAIGELSTFHETFGRRASVCRPRCCRPAGAIGWSMLLHRARRPGEDTSLSRTTAWCRSWSPAVRRITPSRTRSSAADWSILGWSPSGSRR